MADDLGINTGSGGPVSTEQLTSGGDSSHAQRIKIITGAAHVDGGDVTTSNGFPVQVCDSAAHTMPSGDAVARSIAVQVNDGTNVIGTSAHPVRVDPTGTTTQPVSQGTAAAVAGGWPVKVTDGTNTMPTGDALSRAIAVKVTDGTTAITVKAGSTASVAGDTASVVALSPNSPIPYPSRSVYSTAAGGAASLVVKASAGTLFSVRIRNRSASPVYAMVFNSTTVPADGAVTPFVPPFLVPAGSDVSFGTDYFTDSGFALGTGIAIAVSTTDGATKTLAATGTNHDISGAFT